MFRLEVNVLKLEVILGYFSSACRKNRNVVISSGNKQEEEEDVERRPDSEELGFQSTRVRPLGLLWLRVACLNISHVLQSFRAKYSLYIGLFVSPLPCYM